MATRSPLLDEDLPDHPGISTGNVGLIDQFKQHGLNLQRLRGNGKRSSVRRQSSDKQQGLVSIEN